MGISTDRIHNPDVRQIIEALRDYHDSYHDQEAADEYAREGQQGAFDDLPIEDVYSFFDGDPRDMEDHFGDDWESNL